MKRFLITGGCGFIGTNLIDRLAIGGLAADCGIDIRILDNLSVGTAEALEEVVSTHGLSVRRCDRPLLQSKVQAGDIELVVGDIRDRLVCLEATRGVDVVVHLAAHAGVIPSIKDPFYDFEVNALGTLNMLDASVKNNVERFILASSNAPMGAGTPPMREDSAPAPLSPYGASKLACEGYCCAFHGTYALKTLVLRFSNLYGMRSLHKNSVIAKFIKDAMTKGVLTVYGDGSQTRDFLHVDDLCRAVLSVVEMDGDKGPWGETINLGTGRETPIIELARLVKEFFGGAVDIVFEPERSGELRRNFSDIGKARSLLGFTPKMGLKDGVAEVFDWFMALGAECVGKAPTLSGSE